MNRRTSLVQFGAWEPLLVASVLLLAIVLRTCWPTLTEFKFSEARLVALALELTDRGRLPLVGVPSSAGFDHSPLSIYLYLPPFLLTSNPIPATIYGGLIGGAAVALCWWLARRWPGGGPRGAIAAALLFCVSPWAVLFSRKIWQVTFVPLLTLGFVALMISALVTGPTVSNPSRKKWHLTWGIVLYAVLVQVHPSAVSLAPALLLWLIIFHRRIRPVPLVVGVLLAALTGVPFLVHQFRSDFPALSALRSLPGAVWDLSSLRFAWEVVSGRTIHALAGDAYPLLRIVPSLGRFFHLIGWITLAASFGLLWRAVRGRRSANTPLRQAVAVDIILLSWLATPVILNLRHGLDLHLHFFALILPAAFIIIGRGVEFALELTQSIEPKHAQVLRIFGLSTLGLLAVAQVVSLVLMGRFVQTQDTPKGFGTPLARYLKITEQTIRAASQLDAAEILIVGPGDSVVVDETAAIFDVLLRNKLSYRFVNGHTTALFPPSNAIALLAPDSGEAAEWYAHWPMKELQEGYRLVDLDGSWPQEPLQPVEVPRTFENGIEIQSYYWVTDTAGIQEDDSEQSPIRFWLLWQVLWKSPNDSHFYVQLFDEEWSLWGQQDAAGYPTEYRKKGDRVISTFSISRQQPEAGPPLWARAGLYRYPEVVNLTVIDDTGQSVADAVVVGPLRTGP